MGKDFHITRASDWTATEGWEISSSEWQKFARNDPELSSDPKNGLCSFIWRQCADVDSKAWLDWARGNVYSTDPDGPLLEKMLQIAASLGAKVVNDGNEVILSDEASTPAKE